MGVAEVDAAQVGAGDTVAVGQASEDLDRAVSVSVSLPVAVLVLNAGVRGCRRRRRRGPLARRC
jgi:hypothetical protein